MHVNAHLYVPDADCRAPPRRPSHPPVESHEERSHPSNHTTASQPSYPYHRHDSIPAKPTLWTLAILQFKHSNIQTFKHSPIQTFNRSLYRPPDISTQASIVTVQPLGTAFHKRKECSTSPSRDATSQVQCLDVSRPRHSRSDRRYRHASAPRVCGHASSRISRRA